MRGFEIVSTEKNIQLPTRGSKGSAGYDFYLKEEIKISQNQILKVKTGIKSYMLEDEVLELYIRSSVAKKGISLINNVGIIDSDYYNNPANEGEIIFYLQNNTNEDIIFSANERIIQGIFKKYLITTFDNNDQLRQGGFGSTND